MAALIAAIFSIVCANTTAAGTPARVPDKSEFIKRLESGYRSEHYRQDSLMLVDPIGDAYLIRRLDTIPAKLFSFFTGGSLPQSQWQKERIRADNEQARLTGEPLFKSGHSVPIDVERLLNKFACIMRRNFPDIIPVMGEEHRWSEEAVDYLRYGFWHRLGRRLSGKQQDFPCPILGRSKLLLCLACGWTSRYCVTGMEDALTERIMCYPDHSVQIHDVFEESYILNRGNIYLTFLTCENVLAGYPHRKGRENDPLQRKLSYFRHDSKEIGDNYGAWYHFFGIALYGIFRPEIKSRLVAETESAGSLFFEGADPQEDIINRYGAVFGAGFSTMLENGAWLLREEDCDYLLPNPLIHTD